MFINTKFLPTTRQEADSQGIKEFDVILVSGDACVDHPSFAPAIIGRYLQSLGLTVGIIPQPDWHSTKDFTILGKPRLFFGVTAGNLDSMVSLYTAQRKIRSDDPYSENNLSGKRPYLPTIIYTNRIKEAYKDVPVIIGGIEASLRRVAHYDFYTDKVRASILLDAKADLLVYGNGEAPLKEIVKRLENNIKISEMKDIRGTAVIIKGNEKNSLIDKVELPPYEKVKEDKIAFNRMTTLIFLNLNPYCAVSLYQETGTRGVLINPPAFPLSTSEIDKIYALPFTREKHPRYKGPIPAFSMIEYSITAHRGCYGGCNFCSLYMHQGKIIQSRSKDSIRNEIKLIAEKKNKKITITDIGGPTANMYGTYCRNKNAEKVCKKRSCIYPEICKNLNYSQKNYTDLLKDIRKLSNIKEVFINSGIRYDLALLDEYFIDELVGHYTPGQLSVAPEHCCSEVLKIMGKPEINIYEKFSKLFYQKNIKVNKKQYLLPYFIIGHPGADENTEQKLKNYLIQKNIKIEQLQEFYPTPTSFSTAIYYTEMDPWTAEKIKVEKKLSIKKQWKELIIR